MGLLGLGLRLKQGIKAIKSVKPTPSKEARIEWLKKAAKKKRQYSKDYYEGKKQW